jgi:hypothetical protein
VNLDFSFHENIEGMLPAYGVAIAAVLDEEGNEQFVTGHLNEPSNAQVVGLSTWLKEDAKRQLMGDAPYDEEE